MNIRNPFKQKDMARIFDVMIEMAGDRHSELYLKSGEPHRGAIHRCAFWDAYGGMTRSPHASRGTLAWACFRAGQAWRKHVDGLAKLEVLIERYKEEIFGAGRPGEIMRLAHAVEREADRIGYDDHRRLMAIHTQAEICVAEDEVEPN